MFDTKCLDLAEYFLPEDAPETKDLAQIIQDAIEDYLHVPEPEATSLDAGGSK